MQAIEAARLTKVRAFLSRAHCISRAKRLPIFRACPEHLKNAINEIAFLRAKALPASPRLPGTNYLGNWSGLASVGPMKSHSQLARIVGLLLAVALDTLRAPSACAETPETAASATPGGLNLQVPIPPPLSVPEASPGKSESKPTPSRAIENSVVKVFSSMRAPDLAKPWARGAATEVSGTGVVIEGKRILTNAHVVVFSSEIQIQANQAGDKLSATVEAIATGIDLAVLRLDDDENFFETHSPLPCAEKVPDIKDAVMVYGFPTGGTSLSITKGIVSRIEFAPYNFPVSGLRIQLDAAINPGNSGGPAVVDDKMIGLAFSHLGGADNIGYVIPCEEIALFLRDLADGHYDGKPGFYEQWQTLENAALRTYLKLNPEVQGVVVHKPFSDDPSYPLKKWDTITHIGDTPIDDQGMVKVGSNLRVHFPYLIQQIAKDQRGAPDHCPWRGGETHRVATRAGLSPLHPHSGTTIIHPTSCSVRWSFPKRPRN